jgi:pimeloyl-ACP methyl ester carboxylesterase
MRVEDSTRPANRINNNTLKRVPAVASPGLWNLALESRVFLEVATSFFASTLTNNTPKGDGHPVVVLPGLGANDATTAILRKNIDSWGYKSYRWGQGINCGPTEGVLEDCAKLVEEVHNQHRGEKVSLVGWSLGGLYARELAKELGDKVRCVITLGTPFGGSAEQTNAAWLYELLSGQSADDIALPKMMLEPPNVPTTSIFSRTDGVVAWECCLNEKGGLRENIGVPSSHIGMVANPLVLYAVADRLSQDPQKWDRFHRQGIRSMVYEVDSHAPRAEKSAKNKVAMRN